MAFFLEDEKARGFPDREALATQVERAAGVGVDRAERVEAAVREPRERVGSARHDDVAEAVADEIGGVAQRRGRGRARGRDRRARPEETPALGDAVGRLVGRVVEDSRGTRPARPPRDEVAEVVLAVEESGHPPAEDDTDPRRILAVEIEAGVGQRFGRRRQADDVRAREAAPQGGVEPRRQLLDLGRELRAKGRRIEERDGGDAAPPGNEPFPGRREVVPERGHGPEAGHDDAAPVHPADLTESGRSPDSRRGPSRQLSERQEPFSPIHC